MFQSFKFPTKLEVLLSSNIFRLRMSIFTIQLIMTAELIKSWIVRDLGDGKNQPPHRILRGRLSRKTYLLFRFPIVLRYFLKSEKSKHGPSVEFLEIKGVDRPMQRLS